MKFRNNNFFGVVPGIRVCSECLGWLQVQTEVKNMAITNNDDRILHCCLVYQEKVKGQSYYHVWLSMYVLTVPCAAAYQGIVVVFSNDLQLCSKAMINDLKALNRKVRAVFGRIQHTALMPPSLSRQTLLHELRSLCKHTTRTTTYTETQGESVGWGAGATTGMTLRPLSSQSMLLGWSSTSGSSSREQW